MTLPTKAELHAKAVAGEKITDDLVSELTKSEAPEGGNPPDGGMAGKSAPPFSPQTTATASPTNATPPRQPWRRASTTSRSTSKSSSAR